MNQADLTARCLDAALSVILEKETELAHLDSVADGDQGAGMARGSVPWWPPAQVPAPPGKCWQRLGWLSPMQRGGLPARWSACTS